MHVLWIELKSNVSRASWKDLFCHRLADAKKCDSLLVP